MWETGPGYAYEHQMQKAAVFNMPVVTRINPDYPIGLILGSTADTQSEWAILVLLAFLRYQ